MAETLGSLCDKLTIVKLKLYHSDDKKRLESLANQEVQLKAEIDEYLANAFLGKIPLDRLTFEANKVYKKRGNEIDSISGSIGDIFAKLADVNCQLWHEQEKVYAFDTVPPEFKNKVIKNLALLNLERNECMDGINQELQRLVRKSMGINGGE